MNMPRPDDGSREFFRTVLPGDPLVQSRPMFRNVAAFVNGNMFSGLFGDRVFVRLPPDARAELLAVDDAGPFEPMPGRPMGEYVVLPGAGRSEPPPALVPRCARAWLVRSFPWAAGLPPKEKKEEKSRSKRLA